MPGGTTRTDKMVPVEPRVGDVVRSTTHGPGVLHAAVHATISVVGKRTVTVAVGVVKIAVARADLLHDDGGWWRFRS